MMNRVKELDPILITSEKNKWLLRPHTLLDYTPSHQRGQWNEKKRAKQKKFGKTSPPFCYSVPPRATTNASKERMK